MALMLRKWFLKKLKRTASHDADFGNRNDWKNQFEWLKEYIEKYVKFFKPIIKNIK